MGRALTDPALCARLPFSEGGGRGRTGKKFSHVIHNSGKSTYERNRLSL
jgi:hypothetical protein